MSEIKKLLSQSSHYLVGQALLMGIGFISFPILTRLFSVSDYGILGLVTSTVAIVTAVVKLGFPVSIVRHYSESKETNNLDEFYSTMFFGYGFLALCATVTFIIAVQFVPDRILDTNMRYLMSIASILVFLKAIDAIITSFYRAAQQSRFYILINVIIRYGTFISGVAVVLFLIKSLYGYYLGTIVLHVVIALFLIYFFLKRRNITPAQFSSDLFKKSIRFGVFMAGSEIGDLMLTYADRYFIHYYLGSQQLGIYTAGYNLAMYTVMIIITPVNLAIDPIYLSIFSKKGIEETRLFLSKALRYFLLILFPVILGFIAVGKDFIAIMASSKYSEAYYIVPYIIIGYAIYACQPFLNAGLIIRKKTHIFMIVRIVSTILNIGLNIFLIPRYGIIGAAQATLLSYLFYTGVITYFSFKELSFRIDYSRLVLYGGISIAMFLVIRNIDFEAHLPNLISKIGTGVLVYSLLIMSFDSEVRSHLLGFTRNRIK